MDVARARDELGYELRYDLEAGLRDLAAAIRETAPAGIGGMR
jgi:nucleoside-diphosphate-sugar epimerase